jgi:hypothetical protein
VTQLDLLAPCRVPERGTQCYELLMAMQQGKRLTIWNAMMEHHCGALHQRMNDLKDLGWPIQRQLIKVNGKQVAEFWL